MKRPLLLLGLILILSILIRISFLGSIPAGFTPDEASQGYTAYSLLKTGQDEWGLSWPLSSFRSFLDYKAPLQTYLMIPSIFFFGLNEFAVRLPSALFGVLAIIAVYFLTNKIFAEKKLHLFSLDFNLGHLASLFLCLSPWHIQFSRMALEVNLASFLFPAGLYFFLLGLDNPKKFVWTAIFWGFGLYSYHAAKVFIPLFALSLLLSFWPKISPINLKSFLVPVILGLFISLPLIYGTIFGQAGKRGGDLLITKLSANQQEKLNHEIFYSDLYRTNQYLPRVFHNKVTVVLTQFVHNYVTYFTPTFWFTEGGTETTYSVIPGRGLLHFWMLPLVIIGIFDLLKNKHENGNVLKIFLPWLLLAALPAALTREGYRPNRAGSFAVLWEIIAAYGFWRLYLLDFRFKKQLSLIFLLVGFVLTLAYFEDYLFGSKVNYPTSLSYGWREAVGVLKSKESQYRHIYIQQGSQAQSMVAFYNRIDPHIFQSYARLWWSDIKDKDDIQYLDQLPNYSLLNYTFKSLNWPEDKTTGTLYLSPTNQTLPADRRTLHKVLIPNGSVFEIYDFNR